jgi:hypothetical protein
MPPKDDLEGRLVIEDPQEAGSDVGKGSYQMKAVRAAFAEAYTVLKKAMEAERMLLLQPEPNPQPDVQSQPQSEPQHHSKKSKKSKPDIQSISQSHPVSSTSSIASRSSNSSGSISIGIARSGMDSNGGGGSVLGHVIKVEEAVNRRSTAFAAAMVTARLQGEAMLARSRSSSTKLQQTLRTSSETPQTSSETPAKRRRGDDEGGRGGDWAAAGISEDDCDSAEDDEKEEEEESMDEEQGSCNYWKEELFSDDGSDLPSY